MNHPSVALAETEAAIGPLDAILSQLADVLNGLSDEQYLRKPVAGFESSVGAHVRHCLDHVRELVRAAEEGVGNFDVRHRNTLVQNCRGEGLVELKRLRDLMRATSSLPLSREIRLSVTLTCDGEPTVVETSFGREVAFVMSHTIHHNAMIGTMVKSMGGVLPVKFGHAPSTVRAEGESGARGCAR